MASSDYLPRFLVLVFTGCSTEYYSCGKVFSSLIGYAASGLVSSQLCAKMGSSFSEEFKHDQLGTMS